MNNVSKKHDGAAEETCERAKNQSGVVGWALLWIIGIPLPVLLIAYLLLR